MQLYLLQTNSSFPLHLSEPQGMFNLGQICQIPKQKIEKASLTSSTGAPFSDKARCFRQSERALYGNFIIIDIYLTIIPQARVGYEMAKRGV